MKFRYSLLVASVALSLSTLSWGAEQQLSTDIVVIGAGSAGLSAAVQGAEKGKKVVLLEKNGVVGGLSTFAEGLFAVESEWNRLRCDPLTKQEAFTQLMDKHFYGIDAIKIKDFIEESAENIDWLASHGIEFEVFRMTPWEVATWHVITNYKGEEHGAGLIKGLKDAADALGVDTKVSTPATGLITNDKGEVVGVKAQDNKGNTYTISAKAVIIASGGFGDDPEKVKNWAHRDPDAWKPQVPSKKTGDGIQMALDVGAQMGDVSFVGCFGSGGGVSLKSSLNVAPKQPASLWVNTDGNRFTNEDVAFSFSQAANVLYSQYGHFAWGIFDDSQVKYMMEKGIDSGKGVLVPVGAKLTSLQQEIDTALAEKSTALKVADSVEKMAAELGVPEANLVAAVEQYNKLCELQYDSQFYKEKTYLRPLDTKKLYAIKIEPSFFSSFGGLRTNRNHQVLDTKNKPIPGLYAAGLDVSDIIGPTYTTWSSGLAFGFASYSGRHAAIHAADTMK